MSLHAVGRFLVVGATPVIGGWVMGHRAGEAYWHVKDRDPFWEVIAQGGNLSAAAASVGVTWVVG